MENGSPAGQQKVGNEVWTDVPTKGEEVWTDVPPQGPSLLDRVKGYAHTATEYEKGLVKSGGAALRGAVQLGDQLSNYMDFGLDDYLSNKNPEGVEKRQAVEKNIDAHLTPNNPAQRAGFNTGEFAQYAIPIPGLQQEKLAVGAVRASKALMTVAERVALKRAARQALVKRLATTSAKEGARAGIVGSVQSGDITQGTKQAGFAAVVAPVIGEATRAVSPILKRNAQRLYERFLIPGGGPGFNKGVAQEKAEEFIRQGQWWATKGNAVRETDQRVMDANRAIEDAEDNLVARMGYAPIGKQTLHATVEPFTEHVGPTIDVEDLTPKAATGGAGAAGGTGASAGVNPNVAPDWSLEVRPTQFKNGIWTQHPDTGKVIRSGEKELMDRARASGKFSEEQLRSLIPTVRRAASDVNESLGNEGMQVGESYAQHLQDYIKRLPEQPRTSSGMELDRPQYAVGERLPAADAAADVGSTRSGVRVKFSNVEETKQGMLYARDALNRLKSLLQQHKVEGQVIKGHQPIYNIRLQLIRQLRSMMTPTGYIRADSAIKLRRSWDELVNYQKNAQVQSYEPGVQQAYRETADALRHEIAKQVPGMAEANAEAHFWGELNTVFKDKELQTVGHRIIGPIGAMATLTSGAAGYAHKGNPGEALALATMMAVASRLSQTGLGLTGSSIALDRMGQALASGNMQAAMNWLARSGSMSVRDSKQPNNNTLPNPEQ